MKILVTYPLSPQLVRPGLGDLVVYRPELASQSEPAMLGALAEHRPDATLVDGRRPSAATVQTWQQEKRQPVQLIHCHRGSRPLRIDSSAVDVHAVDGTPGDPRDDLRALGLAERAVMRRRTEQRLARCGIPPRPLAESRVTLVGAGIVNLMSALDLAESGADVVVLDAGPDPRTRPHWRHLGTTHGGDNARMFCFTEADNYNEKGHSVYAKMHQVFRRTITDGGWLAVEPGDFDRHEQSWIDRFHALPRWRAEVFTEDIHGFTIASHPLWKRLMRDRRQLFEGAGFIPGILRIYRQAEKARAAAILHTRLGSMTRALDLDELVRRHPACRDAVEGGQIEGALEVRGFTLNIHDFVDRLLARLEAEGVRLHWNRRVTAVDRTDDGRVAGLATADGGVRSDHYVLSPGVYGGSLLDGTRSAGKIQGILGLWMSFPNLEPRLRHSIKLHREGHVGEDSNITLATDDAGRPSLILGSGYGYLGSRPLDMDSPQVARLFEALEETARRYFPRAYHQAVADGSIYRNRRACVRPFTCTGLGIFDVSPTAGGGRMVIASGHNTGGFAQAPAVAEAVTATLEGKPHLMQALYDPERGILPDALMD